MSNLLSFSPLKHYINSRLWLKLWLIISITIILASLVLTLTFHLFILPILLEHFPPPNINLLQSKNISLKHIPEWAIWKDIAESFTIAVITIGIIYPFIRYLTRGFAQISLHIEALEHAKQPLKVKSNTPEEMTNLIDQLNASQLRIQELIATQRLLLAHTSHDLRTPLTQIQLELENIQSERYAKSRLNITKSIQQMNQMLEILLTSARLEQPNYELQKSHFDLMGVIMEESLQHPECIVDGQSLPIYADEMLLRRMIRNLIENAKQHAKNSPLWIKASSELLSQQYIITFEDHGCGIPTHEREYLFIPFNKRSKLNFGYGLGLSLASEITRKHGGKIEYYDAHPIGTGFRIYLPANTSNDGLYESSQRTFV